MKVNDEGILAFVEKFTLAFALVFVLVKSVFWTARAYKAKDS